MNSRHTETQTPKILPLPAFNDNYIWMLRAGDDVVAVDPGDATVVERYLNRHALRLAAILITHHHADHTGGILELCYDRDIPVYGPARESIAGVNRPVSEMDQVAIDEIGLTFDVIEVPGHTQTHVAYLAPGILFPGDTLFSAGCGRLLGGTAEQLHGSLQRLGALPADTRVYCTHEYTLANLRFARVAEPDNADRDAWQLRCEQARQEGMPTLPSSIGLERRINPFLRTQDKQIIETLESRTGTRPASSLECFTALRQWKDSF